MNVFRRNKWVNSSMRSPKKNSNRSTRVCNSDNESNDPARDDDRTVRYSEEDTSTTQKTKSRRPRRHTTGGSQHKDAIQKAKDMVANSGSEEAKMDDSNYGTLKRKELISMLKNRYGNDMEKYRSLKKQKETEDVEHRTVESNTIQRAKKSNRTLSYRTSSELNGHGRRGSVSSLEGSQTSQESVPYSATPPSYDSHSNTKMQAAALHQYAQRNRKLSNGSSVQSDYSSENHHVTPYTEQTRHTVTKRYVVTQKSEDSEQQQQHQETQQQKPNSYQQHERYSQNSENHEDHPESQQQQHNSHQQTQRYKITQTSKQQQQQNKDIQPHNSLEQHQQHINHLQQRQIELEQQQQQRLRELEQLNREQQELLSGSQSSVHVEKQQIQQQQLHVHPADRVLYLQYKDEIKRVSMPSSVSSLDTLKAIFVTSFPGKLSMVRLDDRALIYIKDKEADLFYELEDIRDVQPRSHIQLRERSTSFESLASTHTDMSTFDRKYTNVYNAATLPTHNRLHRNEHYAESLQDFDVRPRSGSGSSLRSDSVLTKPTWQNSYQNPRDPYNTGMLSPRSQKREIRTVRTDTTRYNTMKSGGGSQIIAGHEVGQSFEPLPEPPKLKTKRLSEKEKKGPTVEEQLVDLTKLLHTALNSDEEDGVSSERAPGKLDQDLVDNLEALSEDNYSKSPSKGVYYTPTALLAAKKKQIEGSPEDGNVFNFTDTTYTKSFITRQESEDPEKGYMHDGPDEYMRKGKKFESGLADSILQSLRTVEDGQKTGSEAKTKSRTATTIKISSNSREASQNINNQAANKASDSQLKSPPPTPNRNQSSRIAAQNIKATISPTKEQQQMSWSAFTRVEPQPKEFQMDRRIGIASSAAALRSSVLTLRSQIDELRLLQTNQTRNFKNFMSQSLQDFNALASNVSQNLRSKESGHSIRDRRFRVQEDHDAYIKRMRNVSGQLSHLEDDTERIRREVVQRKRGLDVSQLNRLNGDLESLGKHLAELKSRFSGLHDMLKIVMAGELEIIVTEERFLKDEPGNLDNLFARCKHLAGTLFTLQRLASVQQLASPDGGERQDINQNRVSVNAHSSEDGGSEDERHRVTRTVRFTSKDYSGFL